MTRNKIIVPSYNNIRYEIIVSHVDDIGLSTLLGNHQNSRLFRARMCNLQFEFEKNNTLFYIEVIINVYIAPRFKTVPHYFVKNVPTFSRTANTLHLSIMWPFWMRSRRWTHSDWDNHSAFLILNKLHSHSETPVYLGEVIMPAVLSTFLIQPSKCPLFPCKTNKKLSSLLAYTMAILRALSRFLLYIRFLNFDLHDGYLS